MADFLRLEMLIWVALVLATLLAMLALSSAARHATLPAPELLPRPGQDGDYQPHSAPNERTMVRWSRAVQQSNTAFWTYVSQGSDHRH
jgi:hypothetical protein